MTVTETCNKCRGSIKLENPSSYAALYEIVGDWRRNHRCPTQTTLGEVIGLILEDE